MSEPTTVLDAIIGRNKRPVHTDIRTYLVIFSSKCQKCGPCSRFLPCVFTPPGLPPLIGKVPTRFYPTEAKLQTDQPTRAGNSKRLTVLSPAEQTALYG